MSENALKPMGATLVTKNFGDKLISVVIPQSFLAVANFIFKFSAPDVHPFGFWAGCECEGWASWTGL